MNLISLWVSYLFLYQSILRGFTDDYIVSYQVYPHGGMVQPQASGSSSVSKCPLFDTDNSFERDQKNVRNSFSLLLLLLLLLLPHDILIVILFN